MRKMSEVEKKQIGWLVWWTMAKATSEEYARRILGYENGFGNALMDDVIEDVMETSAWNDEAYYNEEDIRLAIGRVFMKRLGIEY